MSKIVVVGSLNMDIVIRTPHLPRAGETITGKSIRYVPGGKGANQAYAVGKLGGSVAMIGAIGEDENGDRLLKNLESVGVDVSGVIRKQKEITGNAFIQVDDFGENHIVVIPGANRCLTKEDIDHNKHLIKNCEVVMMQLEIPLEVVKYVKDLAKSYGKQVIIDPAPAREELPVDFFTNVDVMKPNETELATLLQRKAPFQITEPLLENCELIESVKKLIDKKVKKVLLTVGAHGGLLVSEQKIESFEGVPVQAVDTTAAGDSFLAAYVVGRTHGKTDLEAIDFARYTSALVVTKEGAQSSIPTAEEVIQFKHEIIQNKNGW